jgi:hypothetical protein
LKGLAYIHSMGVIHADIKPANCLAFESAGVSLVVLADFGLAKTEQCSWSRDAMSIAQTSYFRSPETWWDALGLGANYGFASDIWALAVTLFYIANHTYRIALPEIRAGHAQYKDQLSIQQFRDYYESSPPMWYNKSTTAIPKFWKDLLSQMTRVRPSERPTAEEILRLPYFVNVRKRLFPSDMTNNNLLLTKSCRDTLSKSESYPTNWAGPASIGSDLFIQIITWLHKARRYFKSLGVRKLSNGEVIDYNMNVTIDAWLLGVQYFDMILYLKAVDVKDAFYVGLACLCVAIEMKGEPLIMDDVATLLNGSMVRIQGEIKRVIKMLKFDLIRTTALDYTNTIERVGNLYEFKRFIATLAASPLRFEYLPANIFDMARALFYGSNPTTWVSQKDIQTAIAFANGIDDNVTEYTLRKYIT